MLNYIRHHALLRAGDRVAIAVSGGVDSVGLLRLMLDLRSEVGVIVSVAHFEHRIRGEASRADEQFVRDLAQTHNLEFHASSGDTPAHAQKMKISLEAAARDLRYSFFRELISSGAVSKVATAHTLGDQAETVLLRIIRGTGTAGLAGIYPRILVPAADEMQVPRLGESPSRDGGCLDRAIIRPLLGVQRCEIEAYLSSLGQSWCEDATNADTRHMRNRVRHVLLPLIEREFNPSVSERLAELAEIARVEEVQWQDWLADLAPNVSENSVSLDTAKLTKVSVALQRRIIREVGASAGIKLDFETIHALQRLAAEGVGNFDLPGGWYARFHTERRSSGGRGATRLIIEKTDSGSRAGSYEYRLTWPGELLVRELPAVIRARLIDPLSGTKAENISGQTTGPKYNVSQLLDAHKLLSELTVRNWRPGDRFWPAHRRGPKKVKELLQERHATGTERALWPVILSGDEIVWVRGFPVSERYRATGESASSLLIEEQASDGA